MKRALVMSLAGALALTAVFASAQSRGQQAAPPAPSKEPWQADIDRMYAKGCFFAGLERDEDGVYAAFICPKHDAAPQPTTARGSI